MRTSLMRFGVMARTGMTCWIGTVGTLHVMIGFGFRAVSFATLGALFVATSSASSDSQKKESSETRFRIGDVDDVGTLEGETTFIGEAISFVSSASGFQKNERLETAFVRGDTGEETIFMGGPIQSVFTC